MVDPDNLNSSKHILSPVRFAATFMFLGRLENWNVEALAEIPHRREKNGRMSKRLSVSLVSIQ